MTGATRRVLPALIALLALLAAAAGPAAAHRPPASGAPPAAGMSIPSLTHGQMAVISRNLPAIRALAERQGAGDLTLWRLEDYLNLQSFACLWGVVPGSISDEASPFNECAHAYLAAAQALLLHLREAPGANRAEVEALIGQIETEMLMNGASLALCRYSDEPFNTNEIIAPRWRQIPFHPPSFAATMAALVAIGGAAGALWPRRPAQVQRATAAE